MPELPEVETIRQGLSPRVIGRSICDFLVGRREAVRRILKIEAEYMARKICGQTVRDLTRRGKFLVFELDRHHLIMHLGMTGQLTFRDPARVDSRRFLRHPLTGLERASQHAPDKHTHLQFIFEDETALLFRDIRQFGKVFLVTKQEDVLSRFFAGLGLEPFTSDYHLEAFLNKLRPRKLRLKSLLLDQSFVAGVGNIYADEALFEAGLHPARRVGSLRLLEKKKLFEAIPCVLERGIFFGGTTLRDYVNSDGEEGSHQEELRIYGRADRPCYRCGSPVERVVISQRGSHFCPYCQPRRPARIQRKSPGFRVPDSE